MNYLKTYKNIFLLIVLSLPAVIALIHPGLPPTHDGEYHIIRFYEFDRVLREGIFYPRWAPDLNFGFGLPLFNFVYPLPNYLASFFHVFGFQFIDSFKAEMLCATLVGAVFFYLWSKEYWGNIGGIICSLFYTYSPYHFLDIYIRGSVGEVWALALFPFFLWSVTRVSATQKRAFTVLSGVSLALIIFSHNILAMLFMPFAFSYVIFLYLHAKSKKPLIQEFSFIFLLGIGLSAIFWMPALFEKKFTVGLEVFDPLNHFPELYQLLIPSWGSGFSAAGLENQMSFQIGVANLIALFVGIFYFFKYLKQKDSSFKIVGFFLGWFFLVLYLMLPISTWIWKMLPFLNYTQFPWRFLSLEILITSFLVGTLFKNFSFKKSSLVRKFITIAFLLLPILLTIDYAKPSHYLLRNDTYYTSRPNFMDGTNSPGNAFNTIWMHPPKKRVSSRIDVLQGKVEIATIGRRSTHRTRKVEVLSDFAIVRSNTAYFPGWHVLIDSYEVPLKVTDSGAIQVTIPQKDHTIEFVFKNTPTQAIAILVSVLSLLAVSLTLLFATMKKLKVTV